MLQPQSESKRDWRVALFAFLLIGFLLLSLRFVMTVDNTTVQATNNVRMTLTAIRVPTVQATTTPSQ